VTLHHGDCLAVLKTMPDASVDSIVTDPPYGLSFMGKRWDYDVPSVEIWAECLRVLKPGGHLLAFAGTRTQHRMAVRIEDAGFEIRDMIAWVYGSGFPKSLDVSKAITAHQQSGKSSRRANRLAMTGEEEDAPMPTAGLFDRTEERALRAPRSTPPPKANLTEDGLRWAGWGTALKPALEPITVARKPLIGTVAENVLAHGTGALNVDGCRIPHGCEVDLQSIHNCRTQQPGHAVTLNNPGFSTATYKPEGRWPANLIHDGSEEVGELLGSAARFFYCAKASKRDRDEGCDGIEARRGGSLNMRTDAHSQANDMDTGPRRNNHPTVKPTDLMRYLCRLVTPPGGAILDPYMGSGSTGKAATKEGFDFIGIERDPEYFRIAEARITKALLR